MSALAASIKNDRRSQGELFLDWFSRNSEAHVFESTRQLGDFSYYQFSAQYKPSEERICSSFGRSQDREVAAIKCAAEWAERRAMFEYFHSFKGTLPPDLQTSNGWAVHFEKEEAQTRATMELLERHLLLKSFLKNGWSGLKLTQHIQSPDMELFFLTSCYNVRGLVAGLVAAKSNLYSGVSLGYCIGPLNNVSQFEFWESAIYESVDRILTLNGEKIDLLRDPKSWITQGSKYFLESPFDFSLLSSGESTYPIIDSDFEICTDVIDLKQKWQLDFPLFAARAFSDYAIPLFPQGELNPNVQSHLAPILTHHGISSLPERHPIL